MSGKGAAVRRLIKAATEVADDARFATKPPPMGHNRPPKPPRRDLAADALAEAKTKSKGTTSFADWRTKNDDRLGGLFDYSRLAVRPDVPQTQMKRRVPPRGPSKRMVNALEDPNIEATIDDYVRKGQSRGGMEWYNTDPLRRRALDVMGDEGQGRYGALIDAVAATSPRSRVPDNIRTASYYHYLRSQGLDFPEKPLPGYGSVAQDLHLGNMRKLTDEGWDVLNNPKPASFAENLKGNWRNVTVDTHNMRLPAVLSEDPNFLMTSFQDKVPGGATEDGLRRRFPGLADAQIAEALKNSKKGVTIYRPRDWVESGAVSMDDAKKEPTFWATKPNDNEYGYYEAWQQKRAEALGMEPAQYQASMWTGAADKTGLASEAEPFMKTFEARVLYTADRLGVDPEVILDSVLKGGMPLLAKGGRVDAKKLAEKYGDC
jgi:hypothetical protein